MGGVLSSDIKADIDEAWKEIDKQNEGTIPRNLLEKFVEQVLQRTKLSISKDQVLSFGSQYLIGQKISKQQVSDFYEQQKQADIRNLDQEAIKRQIEYYFSDENLSHDKFFNELITSDEHGYVSFDTILKCQRIKNLKATQQSLLDAINDSTELETNEASTSVRRKNNKHPPPLKSKKAKNNALPEQIVKILGVTVSEEAKISWKDLRDSFRSKYIDVNVVYVRFHGNEGHVGVSSDTDVQAIISGGLDVNSHKATIKVLGGDELLEFWKANGSHFDLCSNTNKRRKVEKTRGINMGGKMFSSLSQLKNYVNSLLNGSAEGVIDPHYHNVIAAVFRLHPDYEKKSRGMKTFSIGRHPQYPESKCYFVVREDGTQEDFSISKCLQQL